MWEDGLMVSIQLKNVEQVFEAYEDGILTRGELFWHLFDKTKRENIKDVMAELGSMSKDFEDWIEAASNGADVAVGGMLVPHERMQEIIAAWKSLKSQ
jgi:hypothetical protein